MVYIHKYSSVPSHHNLCLHKNFPHSTSQPNSCWPCSEPCFSRTTKPSNSTSNIARYRKAVNSALWVQVTLVVCYLPFGIAVALTPQRGMPLSSYLARNFAATIVFLNSSLNPFLYCWKMRQVRQAVKETLRQLFCWSSWSSMYSTILHNSPWDSAAIFIFFCHFFAPS